MAAFEASYKKLLKSGELAKRVKDLYLFLEPCELCPRKCHVNRRMGETGSCRSGEEVMISSYGPHFGEEPELVGRYGSGTIFLTNCNLLCCYCQNYEISHIGDGRVKTLNEVANNMLALQNMGCHNINLVTPSHYAPQLVKASGIAAEKGLNLPIVWNCSGYENVEIIKMLEGIVDIYMPDIKYADPEPAEKFSQAPDYFARCREAVMEMHRQVGDLQYDGRGVALRGLLIRHLVLPNNLAGSEAVLRFVASLSPNSYINIMAQYQPCGEAFKHQEINRRVAISEYRDVIELAGKLGLKRGFG